MHLSDRKNLAAGLFYIVFGGATAIGSLSYPIGTASRMGAGYFPLGIGLALVVTGICVLAAALLSTGTVSRIGLWPLRNAFIVFLAVALFALTLESLGLIVAIPLLIGVSALAHPDFSWKATLLSIFILLPLSWAIFIALLGLQFPMFPVFLR